MALQDLVRFLLPRDDHFYGYLEHQSQVVIEGVAELARYARGERDLAVARDEVLACEHRGDAIVREMEDALARTFVTPLDREDLHRLSSEIDGVLDLANVAIRQCDLLGVREMNSSMKELVNWLVKGAAILGTAVPKLRTHAYPEIVEYARDIRQLEKEADNVYRQAISDLFHDPEVDAKVVIREKEVLDLLEKAIDKCDAVATTLTNLCVKHG